MSEFVIESITELFHLVKSLLPEEQEVIAVKPGTTVSEAIQLMARHQFSQLPVIEGNAVLGVFSYRSFASRLLSMGRLKEFAGDLPVDEFVEQFNFVQLSDNWEHLLSPLNKDDAVLVGGHEKLNGLVTTMDVLNYLRKVASPFVLMAEIEMTLRRVIRACVTEDELRICALNGLASKYKTEDAVPVDLTEMEFNDYAQIIGNRDNWPYFAIIFGETDYDRTSSARKLHQIRNLRNDVFHFKRKIEQQDIQNLTEFRDWLQFKARTFAARQKTKDTSPPQITNDKKSKKKWDQPSFMAALAAENSSEAVVTAKEILSWAEQNMPEIWWGEGKVYGCYIPGFTHNGIWHQVIGVWTNGYIELQFQYMLGRPVFDDEQRRLELIHRLNEIPGVQIGKDQVAKRPSISLETFTDQASLRAFLNILSWYVETIKLTKKGLANRKVLRYQFWEQLLEKALDRTPIHANISPSRDSWISASSGVRGISYMYAIRMNDARIELYIDRGNKFENKQIFNLLFESQKEIEEQFGDSLEWLLLEDKRASIIRYQIEGIGGLQDKTRWSGLQDELIDAMVRLSEAIQTEISQLNL